MILRLGDEGYDLTISKEFINVTANKPAGLFYAIQTVTQLLPAKVEFVNTSKGPWELPACTIRDYPA
jgi:hexosaminidase